MTTKNTVASKELIITPEGIDVAGAVSYWRLSGSVALDKLRGAWAAEGLDPKDLPKPPDAETALRRAVLEQGGRRRLVRPLAKRGAWVIKDETVIKIDGGDYQDTKYTTVCFVRFSVPQPVIEYGDVDPKTFQTVERSIYTAFDRHRAELSTDDISEWLIGLGDKHNAVGLRDRGGIYFFPRPALDFWRQVVSALGKATDNEHRVFKIPAMRNTEAVEAIIDAVMTEASAAASAIEQELVAQGDDKLGKRALEGRKERCKRVLAKIEAYENLVGVKLPDIRERIEVLEASVMAAALAA